MPPTEPDPYAHLSLRDRLELLVFEARLAGWPQAYLDTLWEAVDLSAVSPYQSRSAPLGGEG